MFKSYFKTAWRNLVRNKIYSGINIFGLALGMAAAIALPVIYWAANEWLKSYAFHIRLSWFMFVVPPVVLLLLTLATICLQSIKTAMANPVKSLRTE